MYKLHTTCRACNFGQDLNAPGSKSYPTTEELLPVLNLGIQPLANDFKAANEHHAGAAPLEVLFCPRCGLAQLSVVVDPSILYTEYAYITSNSVTMQEHFKTLKKDLDNERHGDLGNVLEIGSNDGALLKYLSQFNGVKEVFGVDPARNLAGIAGRDGICTYCGFWDTTIAFRLEEIRKYDTIIARHVFAHADDWRGFIRALDIVSHKETVIAIEVPYVKKMFEQKSFDQIYHEHLSYVSLGAVNYLLRDSPFYLHRVIHYPIHGGSILMILRRREFLNGTQAPETNDAVTADDWRLLDDNRRMLSIKLREILAGIRQNKQRVCGYGASAKSTVWISSCKLTNSDIAFICDNTPQKLYRFSPGTNIPIVDEGALLRELPEYCILFAWNFAPEIIAKNKLYLEKGGKFITPLPNMEITQ